MSAIKVPLFPAGQIVATPGALDALEKSEQDPRSFLRRHLTGDWGDVCEDDARQNTSAVENGYRILSAYHLNDDTKIWLITECDRSVTTFLLPSEY